MGERNFGIRRYARQRTRNSSNCQHAVENTCILATAIENLDRSEIQNMLQGRGPGGWHTVCLSYALQAASLEGSQDKADLLLAQGADINFVGGLFDTALVATIIGGHSQMIAWLLQCGAAVDAETPLFCTPLQAATAFNQRRIVSILLEHGADVNQVAGPHHTALQVAAIEGRTDILKILLERGADARIQGGIYGTALRAAALAGGISLPLVSDRIESLQDQSKLRCQSTGGASVDHLRAVLMLLDALQRDQKI